jgi:hypothetical protein
LNLSARLISHGTVFFSLTTKQHQLAYQPQKHQPMQIWAAGKLSFFPNNMKKAPHQKKLITVN